MTKWRPIETAPRDGTVLLTFNPDLWVGRVIFDARIRMARWSVDADTWYIQGVNSTIPLEPTHWMPLPQPPEDE